jgi:hypothetical protein
VRDGDSSLAGWSRTTGLRLIRATLSNQLSYGERSGECNPPFVRTRRGIRTPNLPTLNRTPLPLGYPGKGKPAAGLEPASSCLQDRRRSRSAPLASSGHGESNPDLRHGKAAHCRCATATSGMSSVRESSHGRSDGTPKTILNIHAIHCRVVKHRFHRTHSGHGEATVVEDISENEKTARSSARGGRRRRRECCANRSTAPGHDRFRNLGGAARPPRRAW